MAKYHGKPYDPDCICQDDYEWLTDTGRYTLAGSKTCELCQQEPALYNVDFTTATGYDGKLACPTCTDLLKEQHPFGVVVPLLTREEAIANETRNDPPCPSREDYEWSADPDQQISQRVVFIRYCLNQQCDAVLNAKRHVDDALRVAQWEVPHTVVILALEAVQEALSQQLANLCTRMALISTYPRTGYYHLGESEGQECQ